MKILLLAPQPFYQDRGTPLAVNLVLQALSRRGEQVDVVTYHEGKDVIYDHITIHRIPRLPFMRRIRPGFSWKKVICDLLMLGQLLPMIAQKRYHMIYAIEESVFMALFLWWWFKVPYIYDMDSSLAQQMTDRFPLLKPLAPLLQSLEGLAVKNAKVVIPMCDALAGVAEQHGPERVVVLRDISLLEDIEHQEPAKLKVELGIRGLLLMYIGNLEAYQGIDLLLASFALVLQQTAVADLVIIGGEAADIQKYQRRARHLDIHRKVHFLGPKPVTDLAANLAAADVLISPRIKGSNTPMKLYSYLHSGKAVLATNLPTHTQILDRQVAMLAAPVPEAFAQGLLSLMGDKTLREELGIAGKRLVEEQYSSVAFRENLHSLFDWLEEQRSQCKER
jgi:glycosyltransferase involved in cell wall biosynthesis